jgi:mannose-6-phosphate isomerase-like protein (cupin superfamily)
MSDRWSVTPLAEIGGYADEGRPLWHMVRSVLGIEAFGINAWTATEDGQQLIVEHDEVGVGAGRHEELYVVVDGHAWFTVDGEVIDAPAGMVVHIPIPTVRRSATADAGTTVLVIGGRRGEPFEVSSWERSAEALRFWPTEEWERAIAILQREHVEHPENAGVLYNLACAEARFGRVDDSLDHLLLAVSLEPRFLENARDDTDLASLRDDKRFPGSP